uniref:Uncharacterized protein LOC116951167 n=1 Tax=Petromyzon marinus TaxID=7757 RepID=A0AAJ7X8W3_PETMA|nr:uncharacterized protein LOC116951167 [Petromyzon marinus]
MCMVIFAPIFAILAFATCCGYHGELLFQLPCGNSSERLGDVHVPIQYPFRLLGVVARVSGCVPAGLPVRLASDGATVAMDAGRPSALPAGLAGVVPSARLLVAVGVVSLLYSLCATVATIFYQRNYLRNNRGPKIDVSVSLALSLLWLLASCLWAASLAELRASLQPAHLGALVPACRAASAAAAAAGRDPPAAAPPQPLPAGMAAAARGAGGTGGVGRSRCEWRSAPTLSSLVVAAVFGFINWLLWTGNVWFVYKETGWRAPSLRPLLRHGSAFCASEPDLAASTRRSDRGGGGGGGAAASSAISDRDFERAAGDHVLVDLGGQLGTSPKARLLQPQASYHEYDNPCYTHGEDPPLVEARAVAAAGPAERKGDARMMLAEEVQEVLYRRLGVAALPAETVATLASLSPSSVVLSFFSTTFWSPPAAAGGEGAGAAGPAQATGRPPRARGVRLSTGHSFSADDEDEDDEDDGGDDGKDIDGTKRPKKVYVSIPKLECHDDDDDDEDEDADGHGSGGSGGKRARPKSVHPSAVRKVDGAEEASKRDAAIINDLIKKGYLIVQNDGCGKGGDDDDDDGAGGRPPRLRRQHPIAKRKYVSGGSQRSTLGRQSLDAGGSRFYCDSNDGDGGLADPHEVRARKIHVSVQRRRSTGARSLNDVDYEFDDEGSREVGSYRGGAGGGISSAEEIMVSCGWGSRRGGGGGSVIGGGGGGVVVAKAARPASPTRRSSATLTRPRWAESRSCNSTDTLRVDAAVCAGSSGGSMRLKSPERAWGERRASSVRHHHAAAGAGAERFKSEAGGDARGDGGGARSRGRSTDGRGREGGGGGGGGVDRGRSMDGRRKNSGDVVVDRGRSMDGRGKEVSGCNEGRGSDQLGNRLNLNRTSDYMFERRNSTSRIPARSGSRNLIVTNGGGGGGLRNTASSGYATWATAGTAAIRTSTSAGDQRNMAGGAVTSSATASATASSSWSRRDSVEATGPARRRRSRERGRERGRAAPRRKRRSATAEGAPRHAEDDEAARPVGREVRSLDSDLDKAGGAASR